MITIRYKTDLHESYAIVEIPDMADEGQYAFQMLQRNRIRGVLPCRQRTEEGRDCLYFDIGGKHSLQQEFAEKKMELEDMAELFGQMMEILEETRNYLLTERMIVFSPRQMYRSMDSGQLYLMLLPWEQEGARLQELAEFLLEKMDHRDEHGVNAAYHFYKQQREDFFSFPAFLSVMERESILKRQKRQEINIREERPERTIPARGEPIEEMEGMGSTEEIPGDEKKNDSRRLPGWGITLLAAVLLLAALRFAKLTEVQSMICQGCAAGVFLLSVLLFIQRMRRRKKETNGGEKTGRYAAEDNTINGAGNLHGNEISAASCFAEETGGDYVSVGEETVFYEEKEDLWKLRREERGRAREYELKEYPVTIGKLEGDILLKDPSVSRVHCRIEENGQRRYLRDIHSTNGTFLNGMRLHPGEVMEIEKNDEIRVGKVVLIVV